MFHHMEPLNKKIIANKNKKTAAAITILKKIKKIEFLLQWYLFSLLSQTKFWDHFINSFNLKELTW